MLSGRYPSDEFAELRPRLTWDRVRGHALRPAPAPACSRSPAAARSPTAVSSACSPPTARGRRARRGDGVREPGRRDVPAGRDHLADRGDHAATGSWSRPRRASPARCRSGTATRSAGPTSSGAAIGEFLRVVDDLDRRAAGHRATRLDELAVTNLRRYIDEEREATGGVLPTDRQIVIERFRDELGDWRICVLSPFGAPRARAVGPRRRSAGARPPRRRGAGDLERRRHRRCDCPRPTRRRWPTR